LEEELVGEDLDAAEQRMEDALRPFGWTCGHDFWRRYYSDPWVFNLANAVERLGEGDDCVGRGCVHYPRLRQLESFAARMMEQRDAALRALRDAGLPFPTEVTSPPREVTAVPGDDPSAAPRV
jgi:hypothetical protein